MIVIKAYQTHYYSHLINTAKTNKIGEHPQDKRVHAFNLTVVIHKQYSTCISAAVLYYITPYFFLFSVKPARDI